MAPGVTGNEKKFKALVADFVDTTAALGGSIDPDVVATELRQRIQFMASQFGVTEATVLRTYMPEDWGRDMARQTYRQIKEREAHIDAEPSRPRPHPGVAVLHGLRSSTARCPAPPRPADARGRSVRLVCQEFLACFVPVPGQSAMAQWRSWVA